MDALLERYLKIATAVGRLSPCQSKRGVVIWRPDAENRLAIAVAYNKQPPHFHCDSSDACKAHCRYTAVHAEQGAILSAGRKNLSLVGASMLHVKVKDGSAVVSEKPSCIQCSKLILSSGIKYMYLLLANGIQQYTSEEFHMQTLHNCQYYIPSHDLI